MDANKKKKRYERVHKQIESLMDGKTGLIANMATIAAVLSHKIDYFFWTGFYILRDDKLIVGPYQGPVACMHLEKNTGVCWAGVNQNKAILVPNVEEFPGHIACDSRSKSEIVIPVRNPDNEIIAVLDVDSKELNSFDETDAKWLGKIVELLKSVI